MRNILVQNQMVEIKWSNKIKEHYLSKGYHYTRRNEAFMVKAEDLTPGCKKTVKVICDMCGKEFESPYHSYYERKKFGFEDHCKSCAAIEAHRVYNEFRCAHKYNKFLDVCLENDYFPLIDVEDFTDPNMKVPFLCLKHGVQEAYVDNLINGHKCVKCSYELRASSARYSSDQVEEMINCVNDNALLNKDEYENSNKRNLRVKCGCCKKNVFTVSLSAYISKGVTKCRSCSSAESSGEALVAKYLTEHDIIFEKEKKFVDCRNIRPLPFDFFIPDRNILIEFDGRQHFENVYGEAQLQETKKHDAIKNDYCKMNGIHLIRIPYWEGHNISTILDGVLN